MLQEWVYWRGQGSYLPWGAARRPGGGVHRPDWRAHTEMDPGLTQTSNQTSLIRHNRGEESEERKTQTHTLMSGHNIPEHEAEVTPLSLSAALVFKCIFSCESLTPVSCHQTSAGFTCCSLTAAFINVFMWIFKTKDSNHSLPVSFGCCCYWASKATLIVVSRAEIINWLVVNL